VILSPRVRAQRSAGIYGWVMTASSDNGRTGLDHRVVVIGGGFGGLQVVKHLRHAPVHVTLVDARNFHLFQPLTYQVATGALSPTAVPYPLRPGSGASPNGRAVLARGTGFYLPPRRVRLGTD